MLTGDDIVNIIRACREAGVVSANLTEHTSFTFGLELAKSFDELQQLDPVVRTELLKEAALEAQAQEKHQLALAEEDEQANLHITDPVGWMRQNSAIETEDEND